MEGRKEVLGFYLSENEGSNILSRSSYDLKNSCLQDIFIACMDGLSGFQETVRTILPITKVYT